MLKIIMLMWLAKAYNMQVAKVIHGKSKAGSHTILASYNYVASSYILQFMIVRNVKYDLPNLRLG